MSHWNFVRSPAGVRLLLAFGETRGLDPGPLLRGTRLGATRLADPEITVSASQELAVIANLLAALPGEANLGLQVGQTYHLSAYGILGFGLMSSATGADALALARRFLPLTYAFARVGQRVRGESVELVFDAPAELAPPLGRFVVERAMGAASRLLRDVLGPGFGLMTFDLRFAAPAGGGGRRGPTRMLGATARYGAPSNRIVFEAKALALPLPQANPVTAAMCERMCRDLVAKRRVRLDTVAFVREQLAALPAGQAPDLEAMAGLLNTSERTLKRRLKQEGASFRTLSSEVRYTRARRLIDAGRLTLSEIAAELGFSDLSSFSQAYKRWSGMAPSEARARGPR